MDKDVSLEKIVALDAFIKKKQESKRKRSNTVKPYVQTYQKMISVLAVSSAQTYQEQRKLQKNDPLLFVPARVRKSFPKNGNEGLYGFTYRNTGIIYVRNDLSSEFNLEVDVHESIHTNNEYETRRLTEDIMKELFPKKKPYQERMYGDNSYELGVVGYEKVA